MYHPSTEGALRQGEIVTGIRQAMLVVDTLESELPEIEFRSHPFAIVLSQDCDLDQDLRARQSRDPSAANRLIHSVLFAEVSVATEVRGRVPPNIWDRIKKNKDERYHFLEAVAQTDDALGEGLPELGIDFKRYMTIPTEEIYKQIGANAGRRCRLISPFREHLSTRFCYYQARVALPEEHYSIRE